MRPGVARALLGAALLAAAVVLFAVLQGDGGDDAAGGAAERSAAPAEPPQGGERREPAKPSEPAVPTIRIRDGQPLGGVAELEFAAGERVRFAVESDVADEVHVHGYDVSEQVSADGTAHFDFAATIEGIFEVELETRAEQIAELRVTP